MKKVLFLKRKLNYFILSIVLFFKGTYLTNEYKSHKRRLNKSKCILFPFKMVLIALYILITQISVI